MKYTLSLGLVILAAWSSLYAQDKTNKKGSEYKFTTLKNLEATQVQNQNSTGTCWSFSSLSFFESELIRLGKGKEFNLSEMFVARMAYPLKADNYMRMHGRTNFGEGGGFPDVLAVFKKYGMMPEQLYTGKKEPGAPHNHKLLETTLKNVLSVVADDAVTKIDFESLHQSVEDICNNFLGKVPEKFEYNGKTYTPKSYAEATGINPEDYVFLTSFTHHPYHQKFALEVPDNWNWELMYNVTLPELQETMSNALMTGYTFAWAADVSEKTFSFNDGIALVPEKPLASMSEEERKALTTKPSKQLTITPELRQKAFDNFETQDDHGMHVVGLFRDQNNTLFYLVKNSWGTVNECEGYFYASESYMLYKTTSIMVHKKALPATLAKKLGITL